MATASAAARTTDVKKMSFAKVAASAKKDSIAVSPVARPGASTSTKDRRENKLNAPPAIAMGSVSVAHGSTSVPAAVPALPHAKATVKSQKTDPVVDKKGVEGLTGLELEAKTPSLIVNGTGSTSTERSSKLGQSQTPSDEVSQKADSNSELGTKPPSLDGKSITSSGATTFGLDEKESLRPDDSASVKAAAEDDDAFSVRGSLLVNSRLGSEVAARVHRIQIGDMPPPTITPVLPESHLRGDATPQSGSSEQPAAAESKIPLPEATSTSDSGLYGQNPDEKLLEAMGSDKDRLFLLRLENDVIQFVQNSKEPFMDLPPSNSFCRMLTHKLADYYHMTHSFEAVAGAVRIYRTPFCRIPPPLKSFIDSGASNGGTPPPALLPKKIMRRGEDGELAPVSAGPSKPTSEVGSDLREKGAPTKEKLSREEREEAYNKARERIFGSMATPETSTPDNEGSTGVSRASSVSAMDRSIQGKRGKTSRQRRDDSESFDSRSQYVAYIGHPQQAAWGTPQYIPVGSSQLNPQMQQQQQPAYPHPQQPMYPPPTQTYPPMMPNNGYLPPVSNMQQYPQPPAPARFPGPSAAMPPYTQPTQTVPQQQTWQQQPSYNPAPYQARASPPQPGIPYAYGQLPANANPNDPKSQHPIPGSYAGNTSRHGFNPKTQSFVPGNGMLPMQVPSVPYPGGAPMVGPPIGQPQMPYNGGYQQPMPQPQPYVGNGGDYGMMRQGSNNSMPTYPPPQHPPQPIYQGPPPGPPHPHPHPHQHPHLPPNLPPSHIPNKPAQMQASAMTGQPYGRLPNYGNPATLPQKPST